MAQGEHEVACELIANALGAVPLIERNVSADIVPPVIDATIKNECVETLDRGIREYRKVEFGRAIVAFEIDPERMFGVFGRVALSTALNLQTAIQLRPG